MSYDAVRAQLDKLLGPDRNGPLTSSSKQIEPRYNDSDVCKFYLLGFCPNDLSIKQRSEPGSCPNKHSDLAKKKFETDLKNGKAHEEKVRWTRQLLTQCRSILAAEDRKIRSTARRFQESFHAQGDVTGLMIRSFDTLKALGMVSKDAKVIPYNAKDDNDDIPIDHDPTDNHDSYHGNDDTEFKVKPTSTKHDSGSSADPHSDHQNDDDDDDLDGFGIIKVISKEGSEQSKEIQLHNREESNGKSSNQNENNCKEGTSPDVDSGDNTSQQKEQVTPLNLSTDNKRDSTKDEEVKSPDNKDQGGASSESDESEDEKTDDNENIPQLQKETSAEKEESNKSIMDKFYDAGIGPDGLLMLDRKRSQRVCACCGGCISLVDAEPRLLSHYGGKAHQSLVLLRQKVDELEELVKSDPQYLEFNAKRDTYRHSRADNEYRHFRPHDRGENIQQAQYGWKPRNKGRRGHGTNDWYQNALRQENEEQDTPKDSEKSFYRDRYDDRHERRGRRYDENYDNRHHRDGDNRYDDRYGDRDDDRYSDRHKRYGGHSGRHERSRKRYRTPSPSRRHRRSRR